VIYTPWCDEAGMVIDDGTVSRLGETHFRITAADPSLRWFQDVGYGLDIQVVDVSRDLAALALQGPNSRSILKETITGLDLDQLPYFHLMQAEMDGFPITVTRTGYTGDLGYELWVQSRLAEPLWDGLLKAGAKYGMMPAGMVALDMARIEAGLLLIEVDYISAQRALIEAQKSSPYEIGLGWAVKLDGADFIGRRALIEENKRPPIWRFVGLELEWDDLERLYGEVNLPPQVARRASRAAVPVYQEGRQVGQMTSHTFSPILKKYVGIGTVSADCADTGTRLEVEVTVEYSRKQAAATVVKTPFFDPPRKRAQGGSYGQQ
jgi:aminomethyltransferase